MYLNFIIMVRGLEGGSGPGLFGPLRGPAHVIQPEPEFYLKDKQKALP
jgi:hypothetical protein